MDLFDILYARKTGGGSGGGDVTAAGGFSILWDGITEGLEYIDLEALLGAKFYKVGDKFLSVADLTNSVVIMLLSSGYGKPYREYMDMLAVEMLPGVSALVQANTANTNPMVLSAKAGDYNYNGATVHVPSDGVYTFFSADTAGLYFIEAIYNSDLNRNDYNT